MPLRVVLLDLREPQSDRRMYALSTLEQLEEGDTLLIELNQDPKSLLDELGPVLESGFTFWVAEQGPETWRILIYRGEISSEEEIEK